MQFAWLAYREQSITHNPPFLLDTNTVTKPTGIFNQNVTNQLAPSILPLSWSQSSCSVC